MSHPKKARLSWILVLVLVLGQASGIAKLVECFDPDQYRMGDRASPAPFEDEHDDEGEDELKILAKNQHFGR